MEHLDLVENEDQTDNQDRRVSEELPEHVGLKEELGQLVPREAKEVQDCRDH